MSKKKRRKRKEGKKKVTVLTLGGRIYLSEETKGQKVTAQTDGALKRNGCGGPCL